MSPSILDLYVMSLIDRGLLTKYDLQRQGGVSLGSSTPGVLRLVAARLVVQKEAGTEGQRPRHELKLTQLGRRTVRNAWKACLADRSKFDLDSVLRVADMATHYGASGTEVSAYLRAVASARAQTARRRKAKRPIEVERSMSADLQRQWAAFQLKAEAKFLVQLAERFPTRDPGEDLSLSKSKAT